MHEYLIYMGYTGNLEIAIKKLTRIQLHVNMYLPEFEPRSP